MVQLNFDARQHAPLDNDPLPEGWYNFIIDESNAVPTKDGNPNHLRLVLRFSVMDGPHINRKVFTGLNIRHTNIQTMEIANRELSAICAAVGLPYVQDTQQLHNIPMKGRVKIRKDPTGQYDDQAEIKSYKPISFVVPGGFNQPGMAAPQTAPAAPTGWAPPPQQTPAQSGMPHGYSQPPSQPQQAAPNLQAAPNGGWQQPQQPQPWGQPQQTAPAPVQPTPPAPPPQQPAPAGFAAPTPPPPAQPVAPAPATPEVAAAQNASPPWARG
jgi:hypothetical protein